MPEPIKKEFLSFVEVADFLNQHGYNFDLSKPADEDRLRQMIAELIEERKLTAVFYFDGVITHLKNPNDSQFIQDYFLCNTTIMENFANNEPLDIRTEKSRNIYSLYRKPTEYYRLTNSAKKKLNLLFPVVSLELLFDKKVKRGVMMNDHQDQIEKSNLEEKIKKSSSRSQDDKLITMMALLLAEKSNLFTIHDKPNVKQISEAIKNIAMEFVAKEDLHGVRKADARISKAFDNCKDLFIKYENSKPSS